MAKKQTYKKTGIGATFAANLKLICDVRHVTDEQVMDYMGICRATFYKKMRLPGEWKMEEVALDSRLLVAVSTIAPPFAVSLLTPIRVANKVYPSPSGILTSTKENSLGS